jgi:hypothetical protein
MEEAKRGRRVTPSSVKDCVVVVVLLVKNGGVGLADDPVNVEARLLCKDCDVVVLDTDTNGVDISLFA